MDGNGQPQEGVLHWTGKVLSVEDLRGRLNGQREVVVSPLAIVTPLAADDLKAKGVRIVRQAASSSAPSVPQCEKKSWGYALERPDSLVGSVLSALKREGLVLMELQPDDVLPGCHWARAVAECVARGDCGGGVVFCHDPGLVCCIANKRNGLRAVAVSSAAQAARAVAAIGVNLAAIEVPGRSFFELKQIVRNLCARDNVACPGEAAEVLKELESHAHR